MYGGPRLYRFYSYENILYLPAPTLGWNPDAPWHEVPESQAPKLDNLFIKPGKLTTRGAFLSSGNLLSAPQVCGAVMGRTQGSGTQVEPYGTWASGQVNNFGPWTLREGAPNCPLFTGLGGAGNTDNIKLTNFGFSIPSAATVLGIEVQFSLLRTGTIDTMGAQALKAGLPVGTAWSGPLTGDIGAGGYLWGTTWLPADINNSGFGITLNFHTPGGVAGDNVTLDWLSIIVTYAYSIGNNDWIVVCKVASPGSIVDSANAPLLKPSAAQLSVGSSSRYWIKSAPSGFTLTSATDAVNPTPGFRWINFDGLLYGLSYDGLSSGVNQTATDASGSYTAAKTKLLTMPQGQSAWTAPTVMTNAPQGAFDLEGFEQRIWLIGGIDTPGGASVHSSTTVFYSNPIVSGGGNAAAGADWKDPVAGTTNQIRLDQNADNFGVGLAAAKNGLVIFRRNSIHVIRGTLSANYTVSLVSSAVGCIDARSIAKTDSGIYFLSQLGLMVTDGATVRNVSGSALNTLQRAITEEQNAVFNLQGGYATCAMTPDSNYLVSIGTYDSAGNTVPIWCGLFDRTTNSWVRITSSIWDDNKYQADNLYPGPVMATPNHQSVYALSTTRVANLAGISYNSPTALYDLNAAGSYVPIPAVWETTPLVTGQSAGGWRSRTNAQMKRYFADYALAGIGIASGVGWSVTPVDASKVAYASASQLPVAAGGLANSSVTIPGSTVQIAKTRVQRKAFDMTTEVVDMGFVIAWTDTARTSVPTNLVAELYGIGAEHQKTRDLRG